MSDKPVSPTHATILATIESLRHELAWFHRKLPEQVEQRCIILHGIIPYRLQAGLHVLYPIISFKNHIDRTYSKVRSRTGILWRMRNVISQSLALDLYHSLIEPHFTYGDTIYDGCNKSSKSK